MEQIRLQISSHGRSDLITLLDEKGIEFVKRYMPPGSIVASVEFVDIINVTEPILGLGAWVLVAWLRRNRSRRLIFQTRDNKVTHFEATAFTPAELDKLVPKIESLLRDGPTVSVIQMKKDEDDPTAT